MSAVSFIEKVARRLLIQNQPKGIITIPNRMTTEAKAGEIAATFQRAGLSMDRFDEFITSEADVVRLLNQIAAFEKKNLADNIRSGIRNTESAKVFDLKGKEIPRGSKIMGGKEVKGTSDRDRVRNEMKKKYGFTDEKLDEIEKTPIDEEMADRLIAETDLPPPGSRGGADDIAAPVQSSEETLKNMFVAENKKNIAKMRQRKMLEEAIDDASPGFSGDRKVDAELVAENLAERMGMVYDDLPTKERIKLYDEAFTGLSKKKPDPEGKADGGRIGYKLGSLDKARRAFLKKAAGIGGGIAALKAGLIGLGKQAPETIETVKETVKQAPDYFFALVDKIKRLGTMVDDAVADPRMERTYRYKNYELRENAYGTPDETVVTKIDDRGEFGYKEESMVYKKGGMTEEGRVADEYEEYTIRPDEDGKLKDIDTGIDDVSDIIREVTDQAPSIKKASGGIARMLGE